MKRILAGLASLVFMAILIVGVPAALILLAGNPLPSWSELIQAATMPDWGGRFLISTVLPIAGWAAWLVFTIPFLAGIPEAVRNAVAGRKPADDEGRFKLQRKSAAVLVGAVIFMFGGGQAAMASPLEHSPAPATVAVQAETAPTAETQGTAPAEAVPAPEADPALEPQQATVTVEEGETLWGIAEEELGEGERYPSIFEASTTIEQPGGAHLTDPDRILPGWEVAIPGETTPEPAPEPEKPAETPEPDTSAGDDEPDQADEAGGGDAPGGAAAAGCIADEGGTEGGSPEERGTGSEAWQTKPSAQDQVSTEQVSDDTDTSDSALMVLFAAGGVASVLAGALVGGVKLRRRLQRRSRRRSEQIAMPTDRAANTEAQLREVQSELQLSDVDLVCRYLTDWAGHHGTLLPQLLAIRLAPEERQISVFFVAPAKLPEPFVAISQDDTAWQIHDTDLEKVQDAHTAGAYPALVTIGKDPSGGHLLIDLEQWGDITIRGGEDLTVAAVTAAALELAHSSWSDETRIHLVGDHLQIPAALGNGRCINHADLNALIAELEARTGQLRTELDNAGHASLSDARTADAGDSWSPEVVIVTDAQQPGMDKLRALAESQPRLGVVALSLGGDAAARVTITSHDEAVFDAAGAGIPFAPQLVTRETLAQLTAVFEASDQPATPKSAVPDHTSTTDAQDADEYADRTDGDPEADTAPEPELSLFPVDIGDEESPDTAPDADEAGEIEPHSSVLGKPEPEADDAPGGSSAAIDVGEGEPSAPSQDIPYLRVLGPVDYLGPMEKPQHGRSPEFVAFLALHPNATTEQFAAAFWPNSTPQKASPSMRKLTNQTRNWLGHTEAEEPYLPHHNVQDGYRLHESVRTDWHDFQDLIGDDPMGASTPDLVRALKLVRGQPFAGVRERFYVWAELDKERMIAAIADAADELFDRARNVEDQVSAQYAATLGKMIAPENEMSWRNSLRAALDRESPEEFERQINELYNILEQLGDDFAPEPETQALINDARRQLAGAH